MNTPPPPGLLERWLRSVSRTFALSIELLPESLRGAVRTAYLLCRIVDTIEDQPELALVEREALYQCFDATLVGAEEPSVFEALATRLDLGSGADAELCRGASTVLRSFAALPVAQQEAIRPSVLTMSAGMREYSQRAAAEGHLWLRDPDDLERYCYYVAGTVGELLTALFAQTVPVLPEEQRRAIRERAVAFGLGLQLVNIVKDVASDYRRGDCFLPLSLAQQQGLDLQRLLEPSQRGAALAVISAICQRARFQLERAHEYTLAWPTPTADHVRLFCTVPLALAFASLHVVEAGEDTLREDRAPKVDRATVAAIVDHAQRAVGDDLLLACVLRGWASDPAGERAASCL